MIRETDHLIRNLFSDFKFIDGDILIGSCHDEIKDELSHVVKHMYKVKESKLHWLRSLDTDVVGSGNKRYFIPNSILSDISLCYYIVELGHYYLSKKFPDKKFSVRILPEGNNVLHMDMWMNFYERGNATSQHSHLGNLSGIIFCSTNEVSLPTTFENGVNLYGNFGDICLFPSTLGHQNGIYMGDDDRITISFNIEVKKCD